MKRTIVLLICFYGAGGGGQPIDPLPTGARSIVAPHPPLPFKVSQSVKPRPMPSISDYGAKCDCTPTGSTGKCTDDTSAINRALDDVGARGGGALIIPAGTCIVSPMLDTTYLHLYSNVTIRGLGRQSTIKVRDNAGNYHAVFQARSNPIHNLAFEGFRIDQNAANQQSGPTNVTTAVACANGVFTCQQAAISLGVAFSGSASNVVVDRMFFDTTTGAWAVVAQNDGKGPYPTNRLDARVTNSYFHFQHARTLGDGCTGTGTPPKCGGGFPFYDVSTVYLDGDTSIVSNNIFTSSVTPQG